MTRIYLWLGAFLLLLCQLCAVYGDKGVDTGLPSSPSSDGGGIAKYSDITSMEDGGNDRSTTTMETADKTWLAPSGGAVHISDYIHAALSHVGEVPITGLGRVSIVVDNFFGAFLPDVTNPAVHMSASRARKCFNEVETSALQGPHPASSTASIVDKTLSATDGDAGYSTSWLFCPFTGSLMQTNSDMATSIADGHALSPLFDEDEDSEEKDTDEEEINAFLDQFFLFDDDDDPSSSPPCPQGKGYYKRDGSAAVDTCSVRPMDRPELHDYGNANGYVNGYANDYINDLDIAMTIDDGVDSGIVQDIDCDFDHDSFGKGLYLLHGIQLSVCPVPPPLPPIASVVGPSLASFFVDQGPEFESRWKQHNESMGDELHLIDPEHEKEEQLLDETRRAVAAGEAISLEAYIAASERGEQERKAIQGDHEEKDTSSLAWNILGVVENVTGYVGSLFKGVLPSYWVNPTAGQIRRADECFLEVGSMPVRPGCDPYASKRPPSSEGPTCAASDAASNSSDVSAVSDAASDGADSSAALGASVNDLDYGGGGWFYCVHHGRLVQQDPLFVCSSIAIAGCSSVEMSSPAPYTEHFSRDQEDDDNYALDSLFDTLLAADRTRYEAEHMQLAHFVDPTVHLPAAVEARLARHIAELADERAGFETLLKSILDSDELEQQERRRVQRQLEQVTLEKHITTQMQHLLFGGGGENQREEGEEPSITLRDALPPISRAPVMDECTAAETLHGNDQHATSRGDCRMMNPDLHLFRDTDVSIENAYVSFFGYDTAEPLFDIQGYLYDLAGRVGLLNGRQVESVVDLLWAGWADAPEPIAPVSSWPLLEEPRGAKTAVFTDVEAAMHGDEFEVFRLKAHHEQREAAERERVLRATLSSAVTNERKSAAQSADLAAKLADVQQQLEDAKDERDEMIMLLDEALEASIEHDKALESASSTARTCKLVLDDKNYQLETVLRAEFTGEGAKEEWRLERAKAMLDFEECTVRFDALLDDNDSLAKLLKGVKPRMLSLFEEGEEFRLKEAECRDSLEDEMTKCENEKLALEQHPASTSGDSVACECSGMGTLLADDANPALVMATRQAPMCFEEMNSMFGGHHAVCFVDHRED